MHKWISVLLASVMCVLMVGCTKTTTVTVLSENDSTNIPSVTSATERVTVSSSASTHTTSTKATTNLTTALTTSRENTQLQNNCRLIVKGKDITEGNYVRIIEEHQMAEIPLTAVMKELGAEVEWKGKKVTITHNGYQRVIDTTQQAFGMPRPPCSAYCCRKMIDGEVVIDSVSAGGMIRWMGAQISINVDEKIIEIE